MLAALAALSLSLVGASTEARADDDPEVAELLETIDQGAAYPEVAWMGQLVDDGQYDAALDALDGVLASAAKLQGEAKTLVIAQAYALSARAALAKGDLKRATDAYTKASGAASGDEAAEREIEYDARVGLGWIALAQGDTKTSVTRFKEAGDFLDKRDKREKRTGRNKLGSSRVAMPHWLGLARARLAAGDRKEAQKALDKAIKLGGAAGEAEALRVQALISLAGGDLARARDAIARVSAIEDGGKLMGEIANMPLENHNLTMLGRLDRDLRVVMTVARASGDKDPAATKAALLALLRRKGLILEVVAKRHAAITRRAAQDPSLAERVKQLADLQAELAAMERKKPAETERAAHAERIVEIEDSIQKQHAAIELHMPPGAGAEDAVRSTTTITIEAVQAAIPQGGALLEITCYAPVKADATSELDRLDSPRYAAFLLKHEGAPIFIDIGDAADVDDNVASLRRAILSMRKDIKDQARAAGDVILAGLRPHLGGIKRLWIAPDGALYKIPFEALADPDGHYLIEGLEITYLGSGRDLARSRAAAADKLGPPMVLANPAFDKKPSGAPAGSTRGYDFSKIHFDNLPGTAAEAESIKTAFPDAVVVTGEAVTRDAVLSLARPVFVHIATHGFYLQKKAAAGVNTGGASRGLELEPGGANIPDREPADPLVRSALAVSGANGGDGVISALELSGVDLAGTKLVVLSACETGLGDVGQSGEGVFGLRRALAIAGAETQVMSLWQVDDTATQTMMAGYYKNLRNGSGRSEAMRQIKLDMMADKRIQHPFFWASFLVSGDSTPMPIVESPRPPAPIPAPKAAPIAPPKAEPSARGCACEAASGTSSKSGGIAILLAITAALARRQRSRGS